MGAALLCQEGKVHPLTLVTLDLPAEGWLPGGCAPDISARMAFLCLHSAGSCADGGGEVRAWWSLLSIRSEQCGFTWLCGAACGLVLSIGNVKA